jgi:hypothetical protein
MHHYWRAYRKLLTAAVILLGLWALLLCVPSPVQAGNQALARVTVPVKKIPTWNVELDHSGIQGSAYECIRVKITSLTGPVVRDTSFRVEIRTNANWGKDFDEHVTAFIELGEGNNSVTGMIDVPQRQDSDNYLVKIFHDNDLIVETGMNSTYVNRGNYDRHIGELGILIIDQDAPTTTTLDSWRGKYFSNGSPFNGSKLPDIRKLMVLFPGEFELRNQFETESEMEKCTDADQLNLFENHRRVWFTDFSQLSERWLSLSNADLVLISWADLQALQQTSPQKVQALAKLCMAGSSVIITGIDPQNQSEVLPQIDQLFAAEGRSPSGTSWRTPVESDWRNQISGVVYDDVSVQNWQRSRGINNVNVNEYKNFVNGTKTRPMEHPFHFRTCGFGRIAAWHGEQAEPQNTHEWGWVLNSLETSRLCWERRLGMAHREANRDYWNFLIPGIGQAPVYGFMGMIGIFMLVIGPVNFYFLKRAKRLALLLVTVPIAAALFTMGLILFAFFSDGFSTRARLRSFTILDQGRAACISRHTYFAAFVPSDGLQFPADTAAYPLHNQPWNHATGYQDHFFGTSSVWQNDKLILRSRYLGAREQRQFMVQRSANTQAELKVVAKPASSDSKTPASVTVENRLGVAIEMCLLNDAAGNVFMVRDLTSNGRQEATALNDEQLRDTQTQWQLKLRENDLSTPYAYERLQNSNRNDRRRYYNYNPSNNANVSQGANLLELGMGQMNQAAYRRTSDGAKNDSNNKGSQLPRFYAIVAGSLLDSNEQPLAPLGISSANVVKQSHAVQGSW